MTTTPDTIHRHEIPVDDQQHTLQLTGPVLHVDCRTPGLVELWARHYPGVPPRPLTVQVFGTGQPLPENCAQHVGTALTPGGLVWHLMELTS